MKKFHEAVKKAINSPWLYDNYTDIKDEYYKQVSLFMADKFNIMVTPTGKY